MSKEQGGTAECMCTVQCGEQGGISPVRDVSQGGSASCIEFRNGGASPVSSVEQGGNPPVV
jgi:hypothetical protein